MGLMDKFKNLFTDEEIIEEEVENEEIIDEPVRVKEIKKEENRLPTFMREKIEKEKNESKNLTSKDNDVSDFAMNKNVDRGVKNVSKEDTGVVIHNHVNAEEVPDRDGVNVSDFSSHNHDFKFPISFDESDFAVPSRSSRQSRRVVKDSKNEEKNLSVNEGVKPKNNKKEEKNSDETKVSKLYKDKKDKSVNVKHTFKATPIISPIYGILDKNYRSEELAPVVGDNYEQQRPSKNVDFDSVRKKAYGNLTDTIRENLMCENCEYLKKAKACKKKEKVEIGPDNLMYEALCDVEEGRNYSLEENQSNRDDITLDEAAENYFDYGVEYDKIRDSSREEERELMEDKPVIKNNMRERKKSSGVPPVKSSINLLSTLKKSMGEDEVVNNNSDEPKDLELTDDLFNLIDSMYEERND